MLQLVLSLLVSAAVYTETIAMLFSSQETLLALLGTSWRYRLESDSGLWELYRRGDMHVS